MNKYYLHKFKVLSKKFFLGVRFLMFFTLLFSVEKNIYSQINESLKPNIPNTFTISVGEKKDFLVRLKADDFIEWTWLANDDLNLEFKFQTPSGKNILEDLMVTDSIPLVAPESGDYIFSIKLLENQDSENKTPSGPQRITFQYSNIWKMPKGSKINSLKKVNGYDIKILETKPEEYVIYSYLLIEKAGKLKKILKGDSNMGFFFSDELTHTYGTDDRKSALLMKNTIDKTGEGTPDVAVEYYSGGAHCCYTLYFFELADNITDIKPLETADARIIAVSKNPKGGLRFETADATFRYWNISFADSPMPSVILEFQNGDLRPNFQAMKKPAPSLSKLQYMARASKAKLNSSPYKGSEFAGMSGDDFIFEEAFWGVMLDLIYKGHEELAWQYLDLVWRTDKPGKAIFRNDFEQQLYNSPFWQQIMDDNGKR